MRSLFLIVLLQLSFSASAQYKLRQVISQNSSSLAFNVLQINENHFMIPDYSKDIVFLYEKINNRWELKQEIKPSDFTGNKSFGWYASLSGSTLMVGASKDANNLGAVYFFEKNASGMYIQTSKISSPIPNNGGSDAYWGGKYINIHGSIATVARNNGLNSHFHVLTKNPDKTWSISDSVSLNFTIGGRNVYLSDSLIIAASHYWFAPQFAFIRKNNTTGKWDNISYVQLPWYSRKDYFAEHIDYNGAYLVFSSHKSDVVQNSETYTEAGKVYVMKLKNGTWDFDQEIIAPTLHNQDLFGYSMKMDGNTLLVGANYQDFSSSETDSLSQSGAAYVYQLKNGTWDFYQKLTATPRLANKYFGRAVNIDNEQIVVAESGNIYYYSKESDCMNQPGGDAFYDICTNCVEGTSGYTQGLNLLRCVVTNTLEVKSNGLTIYPNPVSDELTLSEEIDWELRSIEGVLLRSGSGNKIDFSTEQNGVFILTAGKQQYKIVK